MRIISPILTDLTKGDHEQIVISIANFKGQTNKILQVTNAHGQTDKVTKWNTKELPLTIEAVNIGNVLYIYGLLQPISGYLNLLL